MLQPSTHMYSKDSRTSINQDPLTHLEVRNAISKLKNGKAVGLEGLIVESLKYDSSDKLLENFCRLIFEVWEGRKTPESWRISHLTCLWKWKGSPIKPAKHTALNHRIIRKTDHYNRSPNALHLDSVLYQPPRGFRPHLSSDYENGYED